MRTPDKNSDIDKYIAAVCRRIRQKSVHARIAAELESHILDERDFLMAQGFGENEALKKAIAEMGAPKTIGKQFDTAHSPEAARGRENGVRPKAHSPKAAHGREHALLRAPPKALRPSLSLKPLLRAPVKTALTFMLVAAASFALFSRVTDYAVTAREMNTAMTHYLGVAAMDNGVPDTSTRFHRSRMTPTFETAPWYHDSSLSVDGLHALPPTSLNAEQIEAISALPGVTLAETRYMTGGVMQGYERFYRWEGLDWGFNYNARYIIEGTFAGVAVQDVGNPQFDLYHLYFEDSKVLAGNFPLSEVSGKSAEHFPVPDDYSTFSGEIFHMQHLPNSQMTTEVGASFQIAQDPDEMFLQNSPCNLEFIEGLEIGNRYALIGRYSALTPESWVFLGDYDTQEYFPSVADLGGQPEENYLELEEFSRLKELIDITNKDLHTFDVVYTSDMRAIPRVNERSMELYSGRFLGVADTENDAQVCVVSHSFFVKNGLDIGDKLTVELGDKLFMQHAGMGAITYIPERAWNTAQTVELEIVGVYIDTDTPYERESELYWGYHPCTVFVPMSLLPVGIPADHAVMAGEFSVLVENSANIDEFLEAAKPLVGQWEIERAWADDHNSGIFVAPVELRFSDLGWSLVKDSVGASGTAALATTAFYILGAVLALLLSAYLYIGRNKKAYAIMRAMGMPRRMAGNSLFVPFAALSVLAIPVGGIAGLAYTSRAIAPMLEALSAATENYTADASLPVGAIMLCLLGTLAFVAVFAAIFLWKMGKMPVLELLQSDVIRVGDVAKMSGDMAKAAGGGMAKAYEPEPSTNFTPLPKTKQKQSSRKYSAFRHVSRYILRHICRVKAKTAISIVLAVSLMGAVGFLTVTRLFYRDLFDGVDVNASATNFSTLSVEELANSELTKNLYYYSDYIIFFSDTNFAYNLTLTNDFERCMQDAFGGEYALEFADGVSDASFFAADNLLREDNALCIIGSDFGVEPGERIMVMGGDMHLRLSSEYRGRAEEFREAVAREAAVYTVAAVVDSENKDVRERIFAPMGASVVHANNGEHFPIGYSEFTLTDNEKTAQLLALLDEQRGESRLYSVSAAYAADTTELDNIGRVRDLLVALFPVAVAGAVLIGLTAPGLLILQSAKEAAILRVLGTTKVRVRCILVFEQVSLCALGVALAAASLAAYNSGLFTRSAETLAICGALYLFGCVCAGLMASVSATNRKVLYLLQSKE